MYKLPRRYIIVLITAVALVTAGLIASWFSSHGYLVANSNVTPGTAVTYVITNQATGEKQTIASTSATLKRLVRTGSYEVAVLEGSRNAWAQTEVSGFLHSQAVSLSLQTEIGRTFVGNNPSPCMYYTAGILLSYECQSNGGVIEHVAATASTPTYTQRLESVGKSDKIVGLVQTVFGTVLITKSYDLDSNSSLQTAAILGDDKRLTQQTFLSGIDGSQDYNLLAYKQGFIMYSSDLASVLYFDSLGAHPQQLDVSAGQSGLKALGLTASSAGVVAYYSSVDPSDDAKNDKSITSLVVTNSGTTTNRYRLNSRINKAGYCGSSLCVLSGTTVTAYSVNHGALVSNYAIANTSDFESVGSVGYAITSLGILKMSDDAAPNHYLYTFGSYTFCGLSLNTDTLVACLITPRHDKVAVLLSGTLNDYPVDVSVATLLKSKRIQTVSSFQNYIYITPNVGGMSYNQQDNLFSYGAGQQADAQKVVTEEVSTSKLDTAVYHVIDTLNY